jgi:hypothetical protein
MQLSGRMPTSIEQFPRQTKTKKHRDSYHCWSITCMTVHFFAHAVQRVGRCFPSVTGNWGPFLFNPSASPIGNDRRKLRFHLLHSERQEAHLNADRSHLAALLARVNCGIQFGQTDRGTGGLVRPIVMNTHKQLRQAIVELRTVPSSGIPESSHERTRTRRSAEPFPRHFDVYEQDSGVLSGLRLQK